MNQLANLFDLDSKVCYTKKGGALYLDLSYKITDSSQRSAFNFNCEDYQQVENNVYSLILNFLAEYLNNYNSTSYTVRAWECFIGAWLLHFVSHIHYRYQAVEKFLEKIEGNVICINMAPSKHFVANAYSDYMSSIELTDLNESLAFDILEYLLTYDLSDYDLRQYNKSKFNIRTIIKRHAFKFINGIKTPIKIQVTSFSKLDYLKFFIKSKFKISPFFDYSIGFKKNILLDAKKRGEIYSREKFSHYDLNHFIYMVMGKYIPLIYLEGFDAARKKILSKAISKTITDIGIYHSEILKINLMHSVEYGGKLVIVQHGGSYGMLRYMGIERFEINLADQFWTWGWMKPEFGIKLKAMPSHLLSKLKLKRNYSHKLKRNKNEILLALTELPRYQNRLSTIPIGWKFFDSIKEALNLIEQNQNFKEALNVKFYHKNRGWNYQVLAKTQCLNYKIDSRNLINFGDYKKIISESVGTTFLESMALHSAPILLLNLDLWDISDEFNDMLPMLKNANYVFTSVESLSNYLADDKNQIFNYKHDETVKELFINKFAKNNNRWIEIWIKELIQNETKV